MKAIRTMSTLFAVLTVVVSAPASSQAVGTLRDQAKALSWTDDNVPALKRLIPDRQAANTFVQQFYAEASFEPNVGDYDFVDFEGDGNVWFVATLDWSGRGFYTTLLIIQLIIQNQNDHFARQEVHTGGANISDLKSSIVDLRQDGEKEILIPRLLAPYRGATPTPVICDVYRLSGGRYEKADSEFRDYYAKTVLPRLRSALAALMRGQGTASPATSKKLKEKLEKEIGEVHRIVGE